ncbi:primosomal replication protein N [Kingella potus]|uniref:primosomal replication protein N n=1 Tax=Kingella potus TaxID=265175 RepID=UPI000E1B7F6C|nr:primosomal replication protein N [Kingella potus]UOP01589.1 primosomal replication protein N [Kingella potus]
MENLFVLTARIAKCSPLRYTPAGIPVLDLLLQHESQQHENGRNCTAKLEITAKIVGTDALIWQHRENTVVQAGGFLSARSSRSPFPILRIQNIQEYKG